MPKITGEEALELMRASLEEDGYVQLKLIPGRGICGVRQFMFTWALCCGIDDSGYTGRWCYANYVEPIVFINQWNGEGDPDGNWIKYKGLGGERRNPKDAHKYID